MNIKKKMGLGYRAPFYDQLIDGHQEIGWLEIITENYLWDKGSRRQTLEVLRSQYEISCHGVSLSIAAHDQLDLSYLKQLKQFIDEIQPTRVSDHLCWSSSGAHHWHDLLPFPYTRENLDRIKQKVFAAQNILQRPLVLENLSTYVQSLESEMSEYEFMGQLCRESGCRILLDLNNMLVNELNFGIDPYEELKRVDLGLVDQIHLAGHIVGDFAIDTHSQEPSTSCWELFSHVLMIRNDIPFMIEWDDDIPPFHIVEPILFKAKDYLHG